MKIAIIIITVLVSMHAIAIDTYELWWLYRDSAVNETNGKLSLDLSTKLLEISKEINNPDLIAKSYHEIAHDYNRLGNYNLALQNAKNAIIFYKENPDKAKYNSNLGLIYQLIGTLYMYMENYNQSNIFFDKAIKIHKENNNTNLLWLDYTGKGEVFRLNLQFDSTLKHFNLADSLCKIINSPDYEIALSNCNLGLAHLGLNNFEKADSLLQLAFDYYIPNKSYYAVCISYYELAKKELERNNIAKAKQYVRDMLAMAIESNITDQLRDGHLLMHEIAILEHDYKSANQHLKQHYTFKDSLINNKVVGQMAEQRAEFEIDQKQVEVDHFKDLSKARATITYVLSIGLFSILALALFLYKANRKRKAANNELTGKNQIIERQLNEKDMLMREIHHRVKNNLQIITSIINLQNLRTTDHSMREKFSEMQRRIAAISSIHHKLYKSESISHINMKEYISEIVESIHTAFRNDNLKVNYEVNIQDINLNIEAAVSIGLIVNELTTNAFKYAFNSDKQNYYMVNLITDASGCTLVISDDGPGIPKDKDILNSDSLGMRMVNLLSQQLNGQLEFESENGATFTIFFKGMEAV